MEDWLVIFPICEWNISNFSYVPTLAFEQVHNSLRCFYRILAVRTKALVCATTITMLTVLSKLNISIYSFCHTMLLAQICPWLSVCPSARLRMGTCSLCHSYLGQPYPTEPIFEFQGGLLKITQNLNFSLCIEIM